MVILKINYEHSDVEKEVFPFFCNGIFIDTSILKIYFDGLIKLKSKKQDDEYDSLIEILKRLKLKSNDKSNIEWNRFYITPHILTEICRHLYINYDKDSYYKEMIEAIFPILLSLKEEKDITKEKIFSLIDLNKPILKMGDLSIFVSVNQIIESSKKKIAIFVKDKEFNKEYEFHPKVMIIDFQKTALDLKI